MKTYICFTGRCGKWTRDELITKIKNDVLFEVDLKIRSRTSILICETPDGATTKLRDARTRGIKIMTYDTFIDLHPEALI